MIYINPDQIGILACPGGAKFAERIIADLEEISQERFWDKVQILAKKYSLTREEIIKQINLSIDMRPTTLNLDQPVDQFRKTIFEIPAHFTRFANGEFKTEICTTVRNMDVYIIQMWKISIPFPWIIEKMISLFSRLMTIFSAFWLP